ncbi:MAG: quinolinate synthase NadA, partial [Clostridia bacterium]|nr:quinolinate synthase NadA [Clostridia bacterium]
CPMAEQMDKEMIKAVKEEYPDYTVVAYINTTTALKTVCDVCVTSASAVKIVSKIENKNILFIPDCNLGQFVAQKLPDKNIKLLNGGCPIHSGIKPEEAKEAKRLHPDAELLVHPECVPGVVELADFVGSTSAIMDYAKKSDKKEFIIGTEIAITSHLQYDCPDKKFYNMSNRLICPDMKSTTLVDVYNILKGCGGEEITLDEETRLAAKKCIDKMIELG